MSEGYEQILDSYSKLISEEMWLKETIRGWERYENSDCRDSKWVTKDGKVIPVRQLETSHIRNILKYNFSEPLPDSWRKLLETELRFRNINLNNLYRELHDNRETLKQINKIF